MQAYGTEKFEYKAQRTADGSPTLLMGEKSFEPSEKTPLVMHAPEAMHNSAGALTESFYIYYENIKSSYEHHLRPHFLSVGLGLGYNEAIVMCHILKEHVNPSKVFVLSFERDPVIREQYINWLTLETKKLDRNDFWQGLFTEVLELVAKQLKVDWKSARHLMKALYEEGLYKIDGDIRDHNWSTSKRRFTSILFDAFSKKSTPELWSEEFIIQLLGAAADEKCILTTYAATGSLNRALKNQHFTLVGRKGFQGKRESTWAERLELHDKTFL